MTAPLILNCLHRDWTKKKEAGGQHARGKTKILFYSFLHPES
jgi:hypothetical protein